MGKTKKIVLLFQAGAALAGVHIDHKAALLLTELLDSDYLMLKALDKDQRFREGKVLGVIECGQQALYYYGSTEFSSEQKKKQLKRAWGHFEDAYAMIEHLPHMGELKPKLSLSIAICTNLLEYTNISSEWANKAKNENARYEVLSQEDLEQLCELTSQKPMLP